MSTKVTKLSVFVLLTLLVSITYVFAQPNTDRGSFRFECPSGQYLSSYSITTSSSRPKKEECKAFPVIPNCTEGQFLQTENNKLVCR